MSRIVIETPNKQNITGEFYWTGNPDGEIIFLLGSCRIIPYLNYLRDLQTDYKIYCVLPYAFNHEQLIALEQNERLREILENTTIFIKEYHANYGIFNTLDKHEKNIYQFGMKPFKDITIPAFNDCFVFVNDLIQWDGEIKMHMDNGMTAELLKYILYHKIKWGYDKFYDNCAKTDFPEFDEWFRENFTKKRLNWNFNHITKDYSMRVFEMLNEKFLHLPLTDEFYKNMNVCHLDGNRTELTDLDRELFGYQW